MFKDIYICRENINLGFPPTAREQSREKGVFFQGQGKSRNFEIGQGKMIFGQMSGKSQEFCIAIFVGTLIIISQQSKRTFSL